MNINEILSVEELASIKTRSNLRGAWILFCQWAFVISIFAAVATWTNPLTVILGTILLGGRQLGFFILEHECGHRLLFESPRWNDLCAEWLVGAPGFANTRAYMREHLAHHRATGTAEDPDLANYRDYPISRERLRRKLTRDISGRTGWRNLKRIAYAVSHFTELDEENRLCVARGLVVNAVIFAALAATGHAMLYLMWVAALWFVFPLVTRIRQIGEHAAVPELSHPDPRRNTRTIYDQFIWRSLICPHGVNYHLEHHLLPSVPIYNLPRMHDLLRNKGYYVGLDFPRGYFDMLRKVTTPSSPLPATR